MKTLGAWQAHHKPTRRTDEEIRAHMARLRICVALAECGLPSTGRMTSERLARMLCVDNPRECDHLRDECLETLEECGREIEINAWHAAHPPEPQPDPEPPKPCPAFWVTRETWAHKTHRGRCTPLPV